MPATYSNLNVHFTFSTKNRQRCLAESWRGRLFEYMGGITRDLGAIPWAVGGTEDHGHLLAGFKPTHRIADMIGVIKQGSSRWIHETLQFWAFAWQEGYGAFSVSQSSVETVRAYILRQAEHHRTVSFEDEYRELLKRHRIAFDERYMW